MRRTRKIRGGSGSSPSPKDKTHVVVVHAEWCGHCQRLMPEWDKMMESFKNHPDIEVKKIEIKDKNMDQIINELNGKLTKEKINVNGYPTIFLIKGGNIKYYNSGERTADALTKWVNGLHGGQMGGKRRRRHLRKTASKTRKSRR